MRKLLAILALLMSSSVWASDMELLLPVYVKHVQYTDKQDYNENFGNTSLGVNWSFAEFDVGTAYVHKNSHSKPSLYTYGFAYPAQEDNDFKGGIGIVTAIGGYKVPFIAAPAYSLRYKWVRVNSSYPVGKYFGHPFDLVSVQLLIPFN